MTQQFPSGVPNREAPFTAKDLITGVWYNFLVALSGQRGRDVETITVGASPYQYEATSIGSLHVGAGSSSVVLQRGGTSLSCPTSGFIPVAAGDVVTFDYVTVPEVRFVPAPGA